MTTTLQHATPATDPFPAGWTYNPRTGIGRALARLKVTMMEALDAELAAFDITSAQYIVMVNLGSDQADSTASLCKGVSYDPGAMTRMLDRLEKKGLVTRARCPDDRRKVKLALTPEGQALLPQDIVAPPGAWSAGCCAASARRKWRSSRNCSRGCSPTAPPARALKRPGIEHDRRPRRRAVPIHMTRTRPSIPRWPRRAGPHRRGRRRCWPRWRSAHAQAASGLETTATVRDAATLDASTTLALAPLTAQGPAADWWKAYRDPQLDALIDEALAGSPTLAPQKRRARRWPPPPARARASIPASMPTAATRASTSPRTASTRRRSRATWARSARSR